MTKPAETTRETGGKVTRNRRKSHARPAETTHPVDDPARSAGPRPAAPSRARRFPVERAPPSRAFDWKPARSRESARRAESRAPHASHQTRARPLRARPKREYGAPGGSLRPAGSPAALIRARRRRGARTVVRMGLLRRSGAGSCPNLLQRHPGPGSAPRRSAEYQRSSSGTATRSGPLQQIRTTRAAAGRTAAAADAPDRLACGSRPPGRQGLRRDPPRPARRREPRGQRAPAVDDQGPPMTTRRADSRLLRSLTSRASGTYY